MSLRQWAEIGWLKQHNTSIQEIADLFGIVERDLSDARGGISPDWRFGIAYNAALKLATILLSASGYRAARSMHHLRTIQAIPHVLGPCISPMRPISMPAGGIETWLNTIAWEGPLTRTRTNSLCSSKRFVPTSRSGYESIIPG